MSRTLKAKELWKILKGDEKRLEVPIEGATDVHIKALFDRNRRHAKAIALISNVVADSQGQHVGLYN